MWRFQFNGSREIGLRFGNDSSHKTNTEQEKTEAGASQQKKVSLPAVAVQSLDKHGKISDTGQKAGFTPCPENCIVQYRRFLDQQQYSQARLFFRSTNTSHCNDVLLRQEIR